MLFAALAASLVALSASGEVSFSGLDLSPSGRLLFFADAKMPGNERYSTLFSADLEKSTMRQLTFYPEIAALLDSGRRLLIQNRFGIFMTDAELKNLAPLPGFPSFSGGGKVQSGKLVPGMPSPNGSYLVHVVPTSWAHGRLVMIDVAKGSSTTIAEGIEYSLDYPPVRWSPDSKYFVYAKDGTVYYWSIDQYLSKRVIAESYRLIGPGHIKSCTWSAGGSLFYLKGTMLFRVMPEEFFTITLYSGLLAPGTMVGKIPYAFDPNFDTYWISPDGAKILFCKDGRNLFVYYMDPDDFGKSAKIVSLPYMYLQGSTSILQVLWPANDVITIFTSSIDKGKRSTGAYRVTVPKALESLSLVQAFLPLDTSGAVSIAVSPDGSKVALCGPTGVSLRTYVDWKEKDKVLSGAALHAMWVNETKLVVAGKYVTELVDLADGRRTLLALSQASEAGWSKSGSGVSAKSNSFAYRAPLDSASWAKIDPYDANAASTSSDTYRVYVDDLESGPYANVVMVRSVKKLGTDSLFASWSSTYPPFPERDEAVGGDVFSHGSRIRRREVALVFDAVDDPVGLIEVLNALEDYAIEATFFVNGEFIRRNPGAARLLAESGHEIGSMFFASFNPTDARFSFDQEFIRRGLARNEDDYYAATGKELSLLWHVPYYTVTDELSAAGKTMNYRYVGRDVDPLDWVSFDQGLRFPGSYLSSHEIVEKVMKEKKPGSIVPIRLGIPDDGRKDYLFHEVSLLINALINEGFEVVTVSTLMEHAK
jgi:peptidoglycan/xylan/chitin deacetylase (PgdA/CDA1 family)